MFSQVVVNEVNDLFFGIFVTTPHLASFGNVVEVVAMFILQLVEELLVGREPHSLNTNVVAGNVVCIGEVWLVGVVVFVVAFPESEFEKEGANAVYVYPVVVGQLLHNAILQHDKCRQ